MLSPMVKVHVIGHRRRLDDTLDALQRSRVVHIIDVTQDSSLRLPPLAVDDAHRRELDDTRFLGARLESYLGLLANPPRADAQRVIDLDEVRRQLESIGPEIERLARRLDELQGERDTLPRYLASLRQLLPLVPELTRLDGYETMAVVLDARHADALADLNARMDELLAGNFEIISDRVDPTTVGAVVVFPRQARSEVEAIFGHQQVSRLRLPHRYESVPFREAIAQMEERLAALDQEVEDVRTQIEDLVRAHPDWPAAARRLRARQDQLGTIRMLGATTHTFVVSGWVPGEELGRLRSTLASSVGDDVLVEAVTPDEDEDPPVRLENPAIARPYEPLVQLLALPRYGTLDPTSLMSLFLPLFFGMMLGDVAYGVVLLVAAAMVRRGARSPMVASLAGVLVQSALWTVVWGFVYGEFLGDLGRTWLGMRPLWIDREQALQPLLLFALAVGGVHVTLGLILGVWQARRAHDRHTATERAGHLVALIGLFLVVGVFAGFLPEGFMTPAIAAIVVGLVILVVLGGAMGALLGPIELMGTVGNVLSYLRLAAIGLASVYLARVANELGATGPVWLGVVVAALFHALNLVLGVFSPTIQALRLHYVEFFQKFYSEGGEAYRPFGSDPDPPANTPASSGPNREER